MIPLGAVAWCLLWLPVPAATAPQQAASTASEDVSQQAGGTTRAFAGYGFVAPGVASANLSGPTEGMIHWGGGVEWRVRGALAIAGEVGLVHLLEAPEYPGGMLSVNGSYFFDSGDDRAKWAPFVSGGYTLDPYTTNGFNVGAGANYWLRDRLGLRPEIRYHLSTRPAGVCPGNDPNCRNWFLDLRIGLVFR